MDFEQVKRYVDTVKDTDKFKEILEFTRLTELEPQKDLYENIRYYLDVFYLKMFKPDYEGFVSFVEHYLKEMPSEDILNEEGCLDLSKTPHVIRPLRFIGNAGRSTDNHTMLVDGRKYIRKIPLNYPGGTGIRNKYSVYAPVIGSFVAKTVGVDVAEITLGVTNNGKRVLSKNFLKPNEEVIVYTESSDQIMISEQLSKLEQALRLRRFPEEEIETAKFEFLRQEFVAKIIGLKDQKPDNSPIIISTDEEGKKHIRLAPMFDLDYSFQIGDEEPNFLTRKCDNGQDDVASLIEQYKDYPGFKEFAQKSIAKLDMGQIFARIYKETGIKIFRDYREHEEMNRFIDFANRNIRNSKRNY